MKDKKQNQSLIMALRTQGHKENYVSMYCWFLFGSALLITCLLTRRTIFPACTIIDQRPNMDISCIFMLLALELSAGITAMERMYSKKDICYLVPQTGGISHPKNCIFHPCLLLLTKCNWTINNSRHWVEKVSYCLQTCSVNCTVLLLQKNNLSGQV